MYTHTGDLVDQKNKMGAWEVYTRGIGSKLLQKMGWNPGEAIPGGACSREGRLDPVPIKVLPRGKSLDACLAAAKRKNLKIIKSKKSTVKRGESSVHFQSINKIIGDKQKLKTDFKFKPGRAGIMQADQKLGEISAQLSQTSRFLNENLGIKAQLSEQMSSLKHQFDYFSKEKSKMERKLAREKSEKDAFSF